MKGKVTKLDRRVSGGDLPNGQVWKIDVTIDYTNTDDKELMERAFASDLIVLQGQLRKRSAAELDKLVTTGLEITGEDVRKAAGGMSYKSVLMTLGFSEEKAVSILNDPEELEKIKRIIQSMN